MESDILKKKVIEGVLLYKPVIIPEILRECLLMLAHDKQGHNGFKRTYSALKTLYHWKGMKRHIQLHCRRCRTCARHNIQTQELKKNTSQHHHSPWNSLQWTSSVNSTQHPASTHHSVTDALKDFTSSSKHALESKSNKDLNGMILFEKPQQLTIFSLQNPQVSHHSFSCMDMKQMPNT